WRSTSGGLEILPVRPAGAIWFERAGKFEIPNNVERFRRRVCTDAALGRRRSRRIKNQIVCATWMEIVSKDKIIVGSDRPVIRAIAAYPQTLVTGTADRVEDLPRHDP